MSENGVLKKKSKEYIITTTRRKGVIIAQKLRPPINPKLLGPTY